MKRPDFEKRKRLGPLSDGAVPAARREAVAPEHPIAEKRVVYLQYKGRTLSLLVTKVVEQRRSYEGRILGFLSPDAPVLKMNDLKVGDVVCFDHDASYQTQKSQGDQKLCRVMLCVATSITIAARGLHLGDWCVAVTPATVMKLVAM